MNLICQISENEVIAEFLKAEINSNRFRDRVITALNGIEIGIINQPDLSNTTENQIRKKVLGEFRGYGFATRTCSRVFLQMWLGIKPLLIKMCSIT